MFAVLLAPVYVTAVIYDVPRSDILGFHGICRNRRAIRNLGRRPRYQSVAVMDKATHLYSSLCKGHRLELPQFLFHRSR